MANRIRSDIERQLKEKERDLKELYDKSVIMGKLMTITEVSKKINTMDIKDLNTYRNKMFEACRLLNLPPPKYMKGRKLPKKFIDTVGETDKTKLKRVLLPQGIFEYLDLKKDDKILFELKEGQTPKKGEKLREVSLKKYDRKRHKDVELDITSKKQK